MSHPAFETLREVSIPSLNIALQQFRHIGTGATHFHMAADDQNNAFLVAFLTVPQDSTGVAHILEHTSLCGSRRFPVRDPFFMMIRRSLNTFMNAFTASDWTAYPFASQNAKDFDNLLRVYLDAAFFPRLEELDFLQEGHRIEFERPEDPASDLVFKGVVFNEMKGAMSSPSAQVWQSLKANLFPTITYHHNSGGEPVNIPDLTYTDLKAFHERHYHPSNAILMTYGNMPVEQHQRRMHEDALAHFECHEQDFSVPDEQRFDQPVTVTGEYKLEAEEDTGKKTHIVMAWLLGNSAKLDEIMSAMLLTGVLLDHSASPLRYVLETTDLGTAPSELCGLDDSPREAVFVCGLEGSEPERAQQVEDLILGTLEKIAAEGVPDEQVQAVLHQLELSQREIGGDGFPFGLQLMIRGLSPYLHGADPVEFLDLDPVLADLREKIKDPEYVKGLVRELLLDNPHRLRLCMRPDTGKNQREIAAEAQRLLQIKQELSEEDKQRVIEQAQALKTRQESEDDPEVLPKVGLEDIPDEMSIPVGVSRRDDGPETTWYSRGTNGLVYQDLVVNLPALDDALLADLDLFCDCLTEVGVGEDDYLAAQARQSMFTGGLSARTSLRAKLDDAQRAQGLFVLSSKALGRNAQAMADLLRDTFTSARFDELNRLRELVSQNRAHAEARVTDHGHVLAMRAASAGLSPVSRLSHYWDGLGGLKRLKALDDSLADEQVLRDFADRLRRIAHVLRDAPRELLAISDSVHEVDLAAALKRAWPGEDGAGNGYSPFEPEPGSGAVRQAWVTNTQVNFCAKAYPAVAQSHDDAPALTVLGGFLRNGYLHRTIREQGGAYGGGATFSPDAGAFRFYSYRDPRFEDTLADFDHSVDWLVGGSHPDRLLEEAILGVIGSIDRPGSPAGEAMTAYYSGLHGRTPDIRQRLRKRFLDVGLDDLRRVAEKYLAPERASIAVLTSTAALQRQPDLGLEVLSL